MIDKILPGVVAIDIGQEALFVAVADAPVQRFGTFTAEIRRLSEYLQAQGVRRVAMEATGVYWIPLHDHLDQSGFAVTVFHGAHARNLPGRKTDVADCQWHAMRHSHGLLAPCFIPPPQIRQWRAFYRLREDHVGLAAMHIQHMQTYAKGAGFDECAVAQRDQPDSRGQWLAGDRGDSGGRTGCGEVGRVV